MKVTNNVFKFVLASIISPVFSQIVISTGTTAIEAAPPKEAASNVIVGIIATVVDKRQLDETVQFIDGGVGTCRTAEGEETPLLYIDCRGDTPYSMKSPDKFPPFVTGTSKTSFCQHLCAERSECVGFTWSDWYDGGCQLHGFSPRLLNQSSDLMLLTWGQENMCSRKFNYRTPNSATCTDKCVITQTDGKQGRNYHCYYKENQGPSTGFPSIAPSSTPSDRHSTIPSSLPSDMPSTMPSSLPSGKPSSIPSNIPSNVVSSAPSPMPSTPAPTLDSFSWDLVLDTPSYLKTPTIQDGVQELITKYNISDRYYKMEVFKNDCATPTNGLSLNTTNDSKDSGTNHLEVIFLYNQSAIQESNLWTSNSNGGIAEFCFKLGLYSNSSGGILLNFLETIYQIQVDLITDFSTDIDVVRTVAGDGGLKTINVDENVIVYQCNDTYQEIASPPALTQGNALQICVKTEDGSAFEVASFKDVRINQNGSKTLDYVTNFADSYWASSSCRDTNTTTSVCKLKMQLIADFFFDTDPANLTVEGVVKMDFLGRRVLQLRSGRSSSDTKRRLVAVDTDFFLNVAIGTNKDVNMEDKADVGSTLASDDMSSGMVHRSILLFSVIVFMTCIAMYVGIFDE